MKIEDTKINDVKILHSEAFSDERGFLNRIFCQDELSSIQKNMIIKQINHSMTVLKGTVRGLHFQYPPHAELKIVRCMKGSIFDVAVDLRKDSSTFLDWHGELLSADNMKALVIPEGFAHGFQSLDDNIEMLYFHTHNYCKEAEGSLRYDDSKIDIKWPIKVSNISKKDLSAPFVPINYGGVL